MIEKRLARTFFRRIFKFCSIHMYLLMLVTFAVHLVLCQDLR